MKGFIKTAFAASLVTILTYAGVHEDIPYSPPPHKGMVHPISKGYAVIVVDMQDAFWKDVAEDERERELQNQIDVLEHCAKNDIPVAVVEYEGLTGTIGGLKDVIEDVPRHEYFSKDGTNGFSNPDLAIRMKEWDVHTVFMMGVNASACVAMTTIGALHSGLKVATSDDVISNGESLGLPGESISWYQEVGEFSWNYKDFLKD